MTEHVLINNVSPLVRYAASGSQSTFPYPFAIFKASDLQVYLDGSRVLTGFDVSGAGQTGGGSVTFYTAPAAGSSVLLCRRITIARTSDFTADAMLRAKTLNDELDTITAVQQQIADDVSRTPRLPITFAGSVDLTLPVPQGNRAILWNPTGSGLVNGTYDAEILATQAPLAIQAGQSATAAASAAAASAATSMALANTAAANADAARLAYDQTVARGGDIIILCQTSQSASEIARRQAEIALVSMQSRLASAVDDATTKAEENADLAQSSAAEAAASATMASSSAATISVSQAALDAARAAAASSALTASNAAAQALTVAALVQTTDYGLVSGETTLSTDYGVLS